MKCQFIFAIGLLCALSSVTSAKLPVTLFYESLCPFCQMFDKEQLGPSYQSLKDWINVTFVIVGAKPLDDGKSFKCQHGPNECKANMIHACVRNELKSNQDLQVEFTLCQMRYDANPVDGKDCANKVGVPYSKVEECINSGRAVQLLIEDRKIQHQYPIHVVPSIMFNNVFNQTLSNESATSFKSVVCRLINNVAPTCHHE